MHTSQCLTPCEFCFLRKIDPQYVAPSEETFCKPSVPCVSIRATKWDEVGVSVATHLSFTGSDALAERLQWDTNHHPINSRQS